MVEYEKKILLTKDEYLILLKQLYEERVHQQNKNYTRKNYYYDTENLSMNRQGITFRIREKEGRFIATHKEHGSDHSIEKFTIVMGASDLFPLSQIPLELRGCLVTKRYKWNRKNGIAVFLDENTCLYTVDYELEIEYPQGQKELAYIEIQRITDLLYSYGLIHSASEIVGWLLCTKNKSQRFFERYQKLRGLLEIDGDRL